MVIGATCVCIPTKLWKCANYFQLLQTPVVERLVVWIFMALFSRVFPGNLTRLDDAGFKTRKLGGTKARATDRRVPCSHLCKFPQSRISTGLTFVYRYSIAVYVFCYPAVSSPYGLMTLEMRWTLSIRIKQLSVKYSCMCVRQTQNTGPSRPKTSFDAVTPNFRSNAMSFILSNPINCVQTYSRLVLVCTPCSSYMCRHAENWSTTCACCLAVSKRNW